MKRWALALLFALPLGCTLKLNFEEEKVRARVVSYRGEPGLNGTRIGAAIAAADIDLAQQEAPLRDLVIAQGLEVGALASIPVFLTGGSSPGRTALIETDPRLHYGTDLAQPLPVFAEDRDRQYGHALLLKDLGGDPTLSLAPELIIGAPARDDAVAGNVLAFEGVFAFPFGNLVGRLSGLNNEPGFGTSIAVGDLDGDIVNGQTDTFQVLAVGAPGDGAPGSVYLYRTFSNAVGAVSFCLDGDPPALVLDEALMESLLPGVDIGASFGATVAIGELGFQGALDNQAELIVTEPNANRLFVFSFLPPADVCSPLEVSPEVLEFFLPAKPGPVAILDEGTAGARLAVGLPETGGGTGAVALCDASFCVTLPTPAPTLERLGSFTLAGYGASLVAEDLDGSGTSDLVVGAPQSVVGGAGGAGAVFILFSDGLGGFVLDPPDQMQVLADLVPEAEAAYGSSIAVIGDISGDGLAEIAVSAPKASNGKGEVFLYLDIDTPDFTSPFEIP